MANTKKATYAEQIAQEIIDALQAGVPAWRKSWQAVIMAQPANGKSKHQYRGMNAWHLARIMDTNGYTDPRFYTFKQVQEIGGKVNKGEHATTVEFWLWKANNGVVSVPTVDTDTGEITTSKIKTKPFSIFYSKVFNAEQCTGLPEYKNTIPERTWTPVERAENIVKASGLTVHHNQGDRAFYSPSKDEIYMPPQGAFKDAAGYYATLLHELVHATGHATRCNRPFGDKFGTPGYAAEELRAEIGALMLCAKLGINPPEQDEQHKAYIKSWLKKLQEDPKEIFKAANDAERAVNWLFEKEQAAGLAPEESAAATEEQTETVAAYGVPEEEEKPCQQSLF